MGSLLKVISSGSVLNVLEDIVGKIAELLLVPILWGLCDIFFIILDMFDTLYKKFAGIDELVVGDVLVDQDPVLYLINTSAVQEMFFSIMILSLILLVIFTIFAIVKNIYTEKPKPIGEILSSSAKGLLMYLLVPVATVVCLLVGNIVLRAVDGATKGASASTASDMLFMSAAYSANKLRDTDKGDREKHLQWMLNKGCLEIRDGAPEGAKQRYIRQLREANISPDGIIDYNTVDYELAATAIDEAFLAGVIYGGSYSGGVNSKWALGSVQDYYDILALNLITVWAGGAFMIWAMGKITWGLIARMFKMTVFFALSPALMAMYPIDNGKALGSWRSEMVKNGTMAYCAVGTLNVVLSVLPSFSQIKLFGSWWILNKLAALFITIVALASAEKMISTVGGWFGTGDALAEGKATASAVKSAVKKPGEIANKHRDKALGYFGGIRGGIKAAEKQDRNRFLGALTGAFSQTNAAKTYQEIQKKHQDGVKGGGDLYENLHTKNFLGEDRKAFQKDASGAYIRDSKGRRIRDDKITMADEYKGRQMVAEENKILTDLLPAYASETDPIKKKILLDKIKSKSSVVAEKIKDDEDDIKVRKSKMESTQSTLSSYEKLLKVANQREKLAERIFGGAVDSLDLQALDDGDLSGYSADVQNRYKQFAEIYNNYNLGFQEAKTDLIELAQHDAATQEMLTNMGLSLAQLRSLTVGQDGFGGRELADFESAVNAQSSNIQNMKNTIKALEDGIKANIPIYADDSLKGNVTSKIYGKIGKGKK